MGIAYFWMRSAISGGLDRAMISVCSICAFVAAARVASIVLDGMPSNFLVVSAALSCSFFSSSCCCKIEFCGTNVYRSTFFYRLPIKPTQQVFHLYLDKYNLPKTLRKLTRHQ